MFKQAKSAFIWYHLYKFRKTVIVVVLLLSVVIFSQWIYSDIVEYLTLREKLDYLDILLPIKWLIIFFCIGLSAYLITSLFQKDKKEEIKPEIKKQSKIKKEETRLDNSSSLTEREASFLHKKKLSSKADKLING